MVGSVSTMRVSSVTRPSSSSGTLKSTRMNTRLSLSSSSLMVSLFMLVFDPCLQAFRAEELDQVADAAGIPPLIVVPGDHLNAVASDDARHGRVDDGGIRIALEIRRHQFLRL